MAAFVLSSALTLAAPLPGYTAVQKDKKKEEDKAKDKSKEKAKETASTGSTAAKELPDEAAANAAKLPLIA